MIVEAACLGGGNRGSGPLPASETHDSQRSPRESHSHPVGNCVGSDVMKPIAAPIVGEMITSTIHVLILLRVFFAFMKERALRRGTIHQQISEDTWDLR
jgi:hypothetical protein